MKILVFPLPGPSAVTSLYQSVAFQINIFFMIFPEKEKTLKDDFSLLSDLNICFVFFISQKINKSIPIIKKYFYDRDILICREMSKIYEEYIRCEIKSLKTFNKELKGELTIVISDKKIDKKKSHLLRESDKLIIKKMINKLTIKEITELISQNNKVSKKEIYNFCLQLRNEK